MANPLFPADTIRDIAESLGIVNLSVDASKQLAMDVEYRIQEVVQEAQKFMRHSRRAVLSPADVSNALKTLNIEVPTSPRPPPSATNHSLISFVLFVATVWIQFLPSNQIP